MAHSIVNLDKMQATIAGHIESMVHTADLDNGSVVNVGTLVTGERGLRNVVVPATATLTSAEALLIASPEVMYIPGKTLVDFYNPLGMPMRAYHLYVGDIFTLTDDAFTGTSVLGQYLIPANGTTKMAVATDLSGNTRLACQVIEKGTLGYGKGASTTVQVVKC